MQQPSGLEQEGQAPPQDGPLAHYPTFAIVDTRHKWQRITEWATQDSVRAASRPEQGQGQAQEFMMTPEASVSVHTADIHSVDSTLLEMEMERARASMQNSNVVRHSAASMALAQQQQQQQAGGRHSAAGAVLAQQQQQQQSRRHTVDQLMGVLARPPENTSVPSAMPLPPAGTEAGHVGGPPAASYSLLHPTGAPAAASGLELHAAQAGHPLRAVVQLSAPVGMGASFAASSFPALEPKLSRQPDASSLAMGWAAEVGGCLAMGWAEEVGGWVAMG